MLELYLSPLREISDVFLFSNTTSELILEILSLYLGVFCSHVYMYILCVPGPRRRSEGASDLLELSLWMVVSNHVGAGNRTLIL